MSDRDRLSAARGILLAYLVALGLWSAIAAAVIAVGLIDLPPMPWSDAR